MSASAFHQRQKEERSCAVNREGKGERGVQEGCIGTAGESITANERSARTPTSPLILDPFKDKNPLHLTIMPSFSFRSGLFFFLR